MEKYSVEQLRMIEAVKLGGAVFGVIEWILHDSTEQEVRGILQLLKQEWSDLYDEAN